jgi:excisionase family DNA binding protein
VSRLSARQVADRYGIAERTVRRWIASGVLVAEKSRGQFLINPDDAERVYRESRVGRHIVSMTTREARAISAAYDEGWTKGYEAGIEASRRCLEETGTVYGRTAA